MKKAGTEITLTTEEKAAIQEITERMSGQISEVMAKSLNEIFIWIKQNRNFWADTSASSSPPTEFLTAAEVAKILKISRALAYRLIQTREIPSFSIGRTVRIRRADLNVFVQNHMIQAS